MNISKQFYGKLELAEWVEDSFNLIRPLVNKIKIPPNVKTKELDMWIIGPLKNKPGKLFLHGADRTSVTEEIRSINTTDCPNELLLVTKFNTVRKLSINRSATRIAQKLDLLIHGAYTDAPLIHIDSILNEIHRKGGSK